MTGGPGVPAPADAPADLTDVWARTLREARAHGGPARAVPVDAGLRVVEVQDVTFAGFGGHPVRAWLHLPRDRGGAPPVVVRFQGYGSGRGLPHQVSPLVLAGYACLEVDTRGQSAPWRPGHTPDPVGSTAGGPGWLTRGVLDVRDAYYRRVFTDAVRAVDAVRTLAGVDGTRVVLGGVSQGGGIALAAAGLCPDVAALLCDVPFLCDLRRGVELATDPPYTELASFLAAHPEHAGAVWRTLAYLDAAVLGRTARAPALFSAGLRDTVCPPATARAAHAGYGGPKELRLYPYGGHEGGGPVHEAEQLRWLTEVLPPVPA